MEAETEEIPEQVKETARAGSDLLIVDCADPENAAAITNEAVEAGIPLIYVGTEPSQEERSRWEENHWKITYVGSDFSDEARLRAEILEKPSLEEIDANENASLECLVVNAKEEEQSEQINEDTIEVLEDQDFTVEILEEVTLQGDREKAQERIEELMEEYGKDLEVILCGDDTLALAAAEALEDEKSEIGHEVFIIGYGASTESLEAVKAGDILGTVAEDVLAQAQYVADTARAFVRGEEAESQILADPVMVTVDNAQEMLDVLEE